MRLLKGARRCLIAIPMALALIFASAGCGPPHIKIPEIRAKVHDINNSDLGNLRKHAPTRQICYNDQGYPYYCDDGG
jgi:hypothetical protein